MSKFKRFVKNNEDAVTLGIMGLTGYFLITKLSSRRTYKLCKKAVRDVMDELYC